MHLSAFDIIGPPMIGPSSSHTAGAARIGAMARSLLVHPPRFAGIELHGSFAATGAGHATDLALVAGLLGFSPDDERLKDSLALAGAAGLVAHFSKVDLGEEAHPNSVRITLIDQCENTHTVTAASTGGGAIEIRQVDEYQTSFGGELETLLIWHHDKTGLLAKVTTLLACVETNIATLRTSRKSRNQEALTVLEVDALPPEDCLNILARISSVQKFRLLRRRP